MAIFVATLLNLMDAATYGRLLFPIQAPLFAKYDSLGICMYLLVTMVSQLVISLGSSFAMGATGCGMVENIPFYHTICFYVATRVFEEQEMLSTVLLAYMTCALATGTLFAGLAMLGFDRLVHRLPRVVLVGSMGGIGLFLTLTGLEMATVERLQFGSIIIIMFGSWITITLWAVGLGCAIAALLAELRYGRQFMTPLISAALLFCFYTVYWIQPCSIEELRELGWLLDAPSGHLQPRDLFQTVHIASVNWRVFLRTLPTVFGAVIFGSIHVPINVPSYARITGQSFSMQRELWTQAVSNWATSIFGFLPNYFVYTNSLLFLRAGANHRMAGIGLAAATGAILWWGTPLIGYVPTIVPLFLIFYLGISLIWEALIGSLALCSWMEYSLIVITTTCMQMGGFLPGLFFGCAISGLIYGLVFLFHSRIHTTGGKTTAVLGDPVTESLIGQLLMQAPVVEFGGLLHFGNCIEQLARLSHQTVDVPMLIVDFACVTFIDLNFREGFMATVRNSILLPDDTNLVCLNLGDAVLRTSLERNPRVILGVGNSRDWLKEYLVTNQAIAKPNSSPNLEHTRLLMDIPERNSILSPDRVAKYHQDLQQLMTLTELLPERPECEWILLPPDHPLTSRSDPGDGIYIVMRGLLHHPSTGVTAEAGAWLSDPRGMVADGNTTICYLSTEHIDRLPDAYRDLILNCIPHTVR